MRDTFAMYWVLGWQSLRFNILNMSSYWLLVVVSDEKSIINLIKDVLYVMSCFTLAAFKAPLFLLAFSLLWCVLVWISLSWFYLTFAEVLGYVDPHTSFNLGCFHLYFIKYFSPCFSFLSFWDSPFGVLDGAPKGSEYLLFFLHSLFFLSSDLIFSIHLFSSSLVPSSAF